MADASAKFGMDFLKSLEDVEGNLVGSPISAQMALGVTYLAAGGETADEMGKILSLPEDQNKITANLETIAQAVKGQEHEETVLKVANCVFVKSGTSLKPDFVTSAEKILGAEPQRVDFADSGARDVINKWVEANTEQKIKDIIQEGTLDEATKLLLVNAVYFNGAWQHNFDKEMTRPMNFFTGEESCFETQFMIKEAVLKFDVIDNMDASILELPYKGKQKSLIVVLPDTAMGLADIESKMQDQDLGAILDTAGTQNIELFIPKFKVDMTLALKEPLKKLGLEALFGGGADLSGLSAEKLALADVIQKVMIYVEETGTPEPVVPPKQPPRGKYQKPAPPPRRVIPPRVRIENPFLFYVVHKTADNKLITLFNGRVTDPRMPKC